MRRTLASFALSSLAALATPAVRGGEPAATATWDFDGSLADRDGTAADQLSPNGAAAARFVDGVCGQAVALGVAPGDAEFLSAPLSADTRLGADYTIEAWIFPTQTAGWGRLVLNWGRSPAYGYHFALHDGRVSLCHGQTDGTFVTCEGGAVQARRWQHIAAVASRNAAEPARSMLRVYLDGQLVAATNFDGSAQDAGTEPLGIGDSAGLSASVARYRGYLDKLVIRKHAMADADIAARFAARPADLEQRTAASRASFQTADWMPELGDIVFAERNPGRDPSGHYYADFGYACTDEHEWLHGADGARLCRLNPKSGKLTLLLDDPQGGIRDPCVSYDASKILFSYRKGGTHHYNLYEITVDGRDLRQLTHGDWDDVEPCYLPDGGIAFCSSRCKRYVLCWLAPVAVMFRCNADGGDLRMLSSGAVTENTPSVLPDGRILYTRWEYVNRDAVSFHHLWTMNPDGTEQQIYYGNQVPGGVFIDGRPVCGTRDVVFIDSGYHGSREHAGQVMVVSETGGPNAEGARRRISPAGQSDFRDPYPVSPHTFLVAQGNTIRLLDDAGRLVDLHAGSRMAHEPRLLKPRDRERVIPSRVDLSETSATLLVSDVYQGRNLDGLERGAIKKLLVLEDLPKPANYHGGGSTPIGHGGTWTLKRILGTVPVEADGSASFEVPPMRSIYLALLDAEDRAVKQMRSFVTLQPGEQRSCVGCHEYRTEPAPLVRPLAGRRAPSRIEPIAGVPEILDFPRDVQPVLDRHCVECHRPGRRDGGIDLTGDRGPTYSLAFYNLMLHRQVKDGAGYGWEGIQNVGGRPIGNDAPYTTYSSASPLMDKIADDHYQVRMSRRERAVIRLWIDTAAQYAGTYAAYGTGQIGAWWRNNDPIREMADDWPSTAPAAEAVERRCAACHGRMLPRFVTDQVPVDGYGDLEGWQRPTSRFSRHTVFNLTNPDRSLMLLAPLARDAGGYALGAAAEPELITEDRAKPPKPITHPVVFTSAADPDYAKILAHIRAAGARLDEIKRFDMAGFRPRREYLREMKRYGVLPPSFDSARDSTDPYELDRRYWESLSPRPQKKP